MRKNVDNHVENFAEKVGKTEWKKFSLNHRGKVGENQLVFRRISTKSTEKKL